MLKLNIEFQEEYKRLDRLCKDYLSSTEGVSEYIRQMESTQLSNRRYVHTWENDYKQLRHIRWIRNQLAHEVGTLNSNICTKEDLDWVKNFYNRIITGSDPFTIIRKKLEEEARRAKQQEQARKAVVSNQPKSTQQKQTRQKTTRQKPKHQKLSFWSRLVVNIKKFFHKH